MAKHFRTAEKYASRHKVSKKVTKKRTFSGPKQRDPIWTKAFGSEMDAMRKSESEARRKKVSL